MEAEYRKKYHQLEQSHWWFLARRDMIMRIIRRIVKPNPAILDVGCSGGILLNDLKHRYKYLYGIDISKDAINLCRKMNLNASLESAESTGFENEKFDVVICSDVLEHIKDQQKALKEWKRILKPSGVIICFVPAFNFLWSTHDEQNMHYRRYIKEELNALFSGNGFRIIRSSYWNISSFFPRFFLHILKVRSKSTVNSQLKSHGIIVNKIMSSLLRIENIFLARFSFPVGLSVFVIAGKPR